MDDDRPTASIRPTPTAVRPFSRPSADAGRPTPLATRAVPFVPSEHQERSVGEMTPVEAAPLVEAALDAVMPNLHRSPAAPGANATGEVAVAGDESEHWDSVAEYPVDELGLPAVPRGYEYALDESPRESPASEQGEGAGEEEWGGDSSSPTRSPAVELEAVEGLRVPGSPGVYATPVLADVVEPHAATAVSSGRGERESTSAAVALLLERLAARVRAGELRLPASVPLDVEAAVLSGLLTALLAGGDRPRSIDRDAEREEP